MTVITSQITRAFGPKVVTGLAVDYIAVTS